MTLEVRQLVLRAHVRDDDDSEDDAAGRPGARQADAASGGCGGGGEDGCEDKEALKDEILAACQVWLREQLRHIDER
ncbi:hypothetical protein CDN99_24170 [Roseateles aquatilis]|uniref:Uncharacterized protein n=1 Tax=Roseateles aquatilis TaxID=431061 RepID=A0A246IVZ6_9BURK|nr:DUF5908 family protein [Roseateles aquatilis]OWQ84395.1 hypothetical protein CDN99_24170 [Roseateles aquatilis]